MFSFNRAYSDRIIWKNWHLVLKNNTLNILVTASILRSKTREKRGWSNVLAAKNKKRGIRFWSDFRASVFNNNVATICLCFD